MTWEPRPLPDVVPETAPFWEGTTEGKFRLNVCRDCGLVYFYPRALCPDCFSDDVDWLPAAGTGEVYSYSVVHNMSGWPEDDLPVINSYVELDEGPRIFTNIVNCNPEDVAVGMPVAISFTETTEPDVAIPVFEPTETQSPPGQATD
jgi:uncharacterized OB-fold protein